MHVRSWSVDTRWRMIMRSATISSLVLLIVTCLPGGPAHAQDADASADPGTAVAIFAGGCFWCMEPPFDALDGVLSTTSGYIGGNVDDPTYKEVSAGGTGHAEAVRIEFDPSKVRYAELLQVFWHNVDPTDAGGQFCDRGDPYRTTIFVVDEEQRAAAEASKRELQATKPFDAPIVTPIVDAGTFWPAEAYHQDYYEKNPLRYKYYRWGCGRDARLEELWGDAAGH
jgi:peptide-methionine (S)-S-oxide reductase